MATPTIDYQASILGLLIGDGTPYIWGTAGVQGIGVPNTKTADTPLGNQDGAYGAADYRDVRPIICHLEIVQDTDTEALAAFITLREAWQPTLADIPFYIQLPSIGLVFYNGRPRGLEEDLTDLKQGHITCIGTFVALDPQAQTP